MLPGLELLVALCKIKFVQGCTDAHGILFNID